MDGQTDRITTPKLRRAVKMTRSENAKVMRVNGTSAMTYRRAGRGLRWGASRSQEQCGRRSMGRTQETVDEGWETWQHSDWRGYTDCWRDRCWHSPPHDHRSSLYRHSCLTPATTTLDTGYDQSATVHRTIIAVVCTGTVVSLQPQQQGMINQQQSTARSSL